MRYVFNYSLTVAVVTPDGNLARLRFGCGEPITAINRTNSAVDGQLVLNLELADGHMLVNVPVGALRYEGAPHLVPGIAVPI